MSVCHLTIVQAPLSFQNSIAYIANILSLNPLGCCSAEKLRISRQTKNILKQDNVFRLRIFHQKNNRKNPDKKHPEIFLVIFFSGIFHPKSRKHILTYVVTIICDWKNNKLRFSKSDLPMFLKENILETLQEIILVPQCHFQF